MVARREATDYQRATFFSDRLMRPVGHPRCARTDRRELEILVKHFTNGRESIFYGVQLGLKVRRDRGENRDG